MSAESISANAPRILSRLSPARASLRAIDRLLHRCASVSVLECAEQVAHQYVSSITDISELSGLTSLSHIDLRSNPDLSNIQPLLDNTGLGGNTVGVPDLVDLRFTGVSCTEVTALQAKGVTVHSAC